MKETIRLFIRGGLLMTFGLVVFVSCKKPAPQSNFPQPPVLQNKPPVADAGADQIIVLPTDSIELTGIGTDADGFIVNYEWSITGYHSQIGQYLSYRITSATGKLKNLLEGTYWCVLKVTDNGGLSNKDEMVLQVVSAGCPCYPYPCDAFGDPCDPWDY